MSLNTHTSTLYPTNHANPAPVSSVSTSITIRMSHYPRYGFYPSPHPQSFYPHPNQPIPHRGGPISSTQSRASSTSLAAMATPTEEEDAALPDGGWGRDGPLMQARKARGKYTQGRRVNSKDKTANWLRTSQSGPSAPLVEVRQLSQPVLGWGVHKLTLVSHLPSIPPLQNQRLLPSMSPFLTMVRSQGKRRSR